MNSQYHIEAATIDDINGLIEFGKQEFARTFGHLYSTEDLESYLQEGYCVEDYIKWISDDEYRIYVAFSEEHETIVGYVLGGKCSLPLENCGYDVNYANTCLEIKRMYVHPSAFGTGLSDQLMLQVLEWLQHNKTNASRIFLGVYSENPRAIKFYKRYKFEKVGEYGFTVGDAVDREFIFQWKGYLNI